jgi:hypothetical protein
LKEVSIDRLKLKQRKAPALVGSLFAVNLQVRREINGVIRTLRGFIRQESGA